MEKGESQCIVIRLVPAITAVIHDGNAVGAVLCSDVSPLLGRDFVCGNGVVAPPDLAQAKVVGCFRRIEGYREGGLEKGTRRLPVNIVPDVNPVVLGPIIERNPLGKCGTAILPVHAKDSSDRTVLLDCNLHVGIHFHRFLVNDRLENLPGRPVVGGILLEYLITERASLGDKFLSAALVNDGADVAILSHGNLVNGILDGIGCGADCSSH